VQGEVPPVAWVLYVANIFWATAYDTWYAMVDRDDDLRMGAKSTAILFGDMDLVDPGRAVRLHVRGAGAGRSRQGLGAYYWGGLGVAAAAGRVPVLLHRPHRRERAACFRAFLHNHWVGMAVFAGIAVDFAMRGTAVAA
jgi:4-hydroxybenzoate polyprenyltransferase